MSHITRYAFKGGTRLAADAGVSKSAVCRLLNGQSSPSYTLLHLILRSLERHLGKSLDPRELVSLDGTYPTASVCRLTDCSGCLPAEAFDTEGNLTAEFKHFKPGCWSISRSTASRSTAATHPSSVNHPSTQAPTRDQEESRTQESPHKPRHKARHQRKHKAKRGTTPAEITNRGAR